MGKGIFLAAASVLALGPGLSLARADALVDEAKAVVEKATSRADKWDGPTAGPKEPVARAPASCQSP